MDSTPMKKMSQVHVEIPEPKAMKKNEGVTPSADPGVPYFNEKTGEYNENHREAGNREQLKPSTDKQFSRY